VCLDLVAVAAAVFLLHHAAGCGQAGDDAAGAAFGDARAGMFGEQMVSVGLFGQGKERTAKLLTPVTL